MYHRGQADCTAPGCTIPITEHPQLSYIPGQTAMQSPGVRPLSACLRCRTNRSSSQPLTNLLQVTDYSSSPEALSEKVTSPAIVRLAVVLISLHTSGYAPE